MISCRNADQVLADRQPVDTVGFAQHAWQVDSVLARIERLQSVQLKGAGALTDNSTSLRVAISPHDDYTYVGYLYPALFEHVRSEVVLLFGVGHKARLFGLEDKIVFGSYGSWKSPGGAVEISALQNSIMKKMPEDQFIVHDSLQTVEHSLEALVPFLEHYNPHVKIIPVIVPAMSFDRMETIAASLSEAILETMEDAGLSWGTGWSVVISTDAVHYGNDDWGGKNYDRFGVDSAGYFLAVEYEKQIMNGMLAGDLTPEKIKAFSTCTVSDNDYHEYKWTWCGRYSIPLGLLTAYDMSVKTTRPLTGLSVGYSTSIANEPVPVADLGMGVTAPAKLTHWVGYAAVGFE
ncbi:MAG TPA: AmmeMemoRadiSam system protein B [Bacteroidales bacterium]|nr:AmmeMemoRadiSam system protein B [Bacteroidales bacterium]